MYLGTHARVQPEHPALLLPATGESRTYFELECRTNQLAHLLRAHGLKPGSHIALFIGNDLAFFDVVWAALRSGLYVTPVNRYLPAGEAAYIVDNCDAEALIASARLPESAELGRLASRCAVKLSVDGVIPGFDAFEPAIAAFPTTPVPDEQIGSLMLYSSGTTGRPKGIRRPLSGRPAAEGNPAMKATGDSFGFGPGTVYLNPAPLYHSAPAGFTTAVLQAGGTVVLMDRFDPEAALSLIDRYRVTHSQWVPTMFIRMLKLPADVRSRYDLTSHRCAIHAAAPCPVEVKREMIGWWGPILEEFYSSTEQAGFARIGSVEWLAHPGSVGRDPNAPFHICDEDGRELPPGEPGLIFGESPSGVQFSYHKDNGKTASASHPLHPTWRTVGDIGYVDEEGYLYLTDRKSFMIISGGVNIYPQQIEDALALHPKIADVAVIGVPNVELGEEIKAVVEPASGVVPSDLLAQEIMQFVRERLGRQLTPRTVEFTDALPRLPTGKLYKKALRDRYWPAPEMRAL
ncbi:acyl-CoA synthetase [Sphingomonas sp. BIUV-7]|uniref:Acyl-CoA synthetase n=1 Tax=Sphingomonas natans TaxID=3063330 RepID=A0ABT8Y836_9SPHN|nr:acyl-CoA synthetase [Sphingomonas sp. BIUV-7]MDO6414482.1 acyl-CoA synthetase [Sphingomonas sp. BIUV-7]